MRFAVVADPSSPHTRVWVDALAAREHDVFLFSPHKAPPPAGLHATVTAPLAGASHVISRSPAPPPNSNTPQRTSLELRTVTRALRLVLPFRRWMRTTRPNRLLALRFQPEAYLAASARFHPFAAVSWGQDVLRFSSCHAAHRWSTRRVFRAADRLYGETGVVLEAMERLGAPRAKLTRAITGIDLDFWSAGAREALPDPARRSDWTPWLEDVAHGRALLLSPRAFDRNGHQRELVAAWSGLVNPPHLALVGVGNEAERARCRADAEAAGRGALYHDLGPVTPEEMRHLFHIANCVASLWSPDGLSQTLLEAMAAGKLPLAARIPGNAEWIEDGANGLLADPRDPNDVRRALERAFADPELRARASVENRARIAAGADRSKNLTRWIEELESMSA